MTNQPENETTEQLPQPSYEARFTEIETALATQQVLLQEVISKLDLLIKMQQDMYVDLRGRMTSMESNIHQRLTSIEHNLHQVQQDIQPDSFQNRLMRMGQSSLP